MSKTLKMLILLIVLAAAVLAVAVSSRASVGKTGQAWGKAEVKINGQYITADVVKDEAARDKGLSGRADLGANEGMLFLFKNLGNYGFWMKGMVIPIDLIWISDGKTVGFEQNMQPPATGTPDNNLQVYYPPQPIDEVLELKAGRILTLGAETGDAVSVKPLVPESGVLSNPQ